MGFLSSLRTPPAPVRRSGQTPVHCRGCPACAWRWGGAPAPGPARRDPSPSPQPAGVCRAGLLPFLLLSPSAPSQVSAEERSRALPPVYALELLTIFAWEQGCGKDTFSLAQGFRTVLGLIQQYQKLCVFWTVNYSFADPTVGSFLQGQLEKPRYVLTPATRSPVPGLAELMNSGGAGGSPQLYLSVTQGHL